MKLNCSTKVKSVSFATVALILGMGARWTVVHGQEAAETPTVATINAGDVYVRSGDSMNHYTISKLQAGDKVTVVGERGEWLEILPPEGAFSLVSGDFVDTTDNTSGTINGDNVRVRAGSLLNENKYTVQTLLAKGTKVDILGRNADGFVRIKPPPGATVWVNRSFVNTGAGSDIVVARKAPTNSTGEGVADASPALAITASQAGSVKKPAAAIVNAGLRRQLEETDEAARAELAKPIAERRFEPIIARYKPIADQTEDDFAREYAKARMEQAVNLAALASAIQKVNSLDEKAKSQRYESLAARSLIPEPTPLTEPAGIEVQGELRISALYPPGSPTPRYRLIDPVQGAERTIGYVEIPADAHMNVDAFLGRYVGIRASAQRIQTGGVNPIPIYITRELMLMEPPLASGQKRN
jgi:hypothetical protein